MRPADHRHLRVALAEPGGKRCDVVAAFARSGAGVFLTVEPIENNIGQIELASRLSHANSTEDEG
jgi:hypothetical protein